MALFGDIIGYIHAGQAGRGLQNAYNTGAQQVGTATSGAINRIDQSLQNNRADINNATYASNAAVQGSADTANANIGDLYQQVTGNLSPYLQGGQQGVQQLSSYAASNPQFKFNLDDYFNSPAYNFQLEQGNKAIGNAASSQGLAAGGGVLKDMDKYGQGLAANYYGQAYNQALQGFQTNQGTTLANLSALINSGISASGQMGQAAADTANLQSRNTMQAGMFGGANTADAARYLASQGYQGNVQAGQMGMTGANQVANYGIGAADARASQIMNQGKQLTAGSEDIGAMLLKLLGLQG